MAPNMSFQLDYTRPRRSQKMFRFGVRLARRTGDAPATSGDRRILIMGRDGFAYVIAKDESSLRAARREGRA